jgi:ferritin-like metal-binding protein YciE
MQTAHELFIHELTDMLSAERQLVEALQGQEEAVSRDELKKAFASHRAQTEKQVERLEQCFESIGEEPEEKECKGIAGLVEEFQEFVEEEDPSEDIIDVVAIGAAQKVESYEINSYNSLIELARMMGHSQAEKLLQQSLREEESTLQKMEGFSKKVKPQEMGMEEMEEEAGGQEASQSRNRSQKKSAKKASGRGKSRRVA